MTLEAIRVPAIEYGMCYYCGKAVPLDKKPGFGDTCDTCGKDLHVCVMCRFYKPGAHWDCAETVDGPVSDKRRRNFCEWFAVDPKFGLPGEGEAKARNAAESARSAFDSLFGA